MKLPVAACWYLLLDPSGSERDEPLRLHHQAEFLLDLPQAVQRFLPRREVTGGRDIEVARPGIFHGSPSLKKEVGSPGIQAADPTVKTTVPQPKPVRLALRNDLAGRPPELIENVEHLLHTNKISISARFGLRPSLVSTFRPGPAFVRARMLIC